MIWIIWMIMGQAPIKMINYYAAPNSKKFSFAVFITINDHGCFFFSTNNHLGRHTVAIATS